MDKPKVLIVGDDHDSAISKAVQTLHKNYDVQIIEKESEMKKCLQERNYSTGEQLLMRNAVSALSAIETLGRYGGNVLPERVIEQKMAEKYADATGVQERIDAADQRRAKKNAKRLANIRR